MSIPTLMVRYADWNSNSPFSCSWMYTQPTGGSYWSSSKYTCSAAGGCADSTTSYTGYNYLSWSGNEVGGTIWVDGDLTLKCTLPPQVWYTSNPPDSRVMSYFIQ
jgi:hypothetical protein